MLWLLKVIIILSISASIVKTTKPNKNNTNFYVLLWTPRFTKPFSYFKLGYRSFKERNCKYQNCFVTDDASHFRDVRNFDVVLFNAINVNTELLDLPEFRSERQLYVLVSKDFPTNHPVTSNYNNIFNLTWTHRLDSDITWPNMVIKDINGSIIGPGINMKWISPKTVKSPSKSVLETIKNKNKAVAYMVTNCDAKSDREQYINELSNVLLKYGYTVDKLSKCNDLNGICFILDGNESNKTIEKACNDLECPNKMVLKSCEALIESDYYFHLVFEDVFADDYVSGSLLTALENFSVPVVFGGANYSRFMPDGAYINAQGFSLKQLAYKMVQLIRNRQAYNKMFQWRNYYVYSAPEVSSISDPICKFCAFLNVRNRTKKFVQKQYKDIVSWYKKQSNTYGLYKTKTQMSDLDNIQFHLNTNLCESEKPLAFIRIVLSATNHFKLRQAIRETWVNHTDALKAVFMLGETNSKIEAQAIENEYKEYGDIVQGNFKDVFKNLTYKHLMALHWVTKFCPNAKFVLKTDDDVFVNTLVLRRLLNNLTENDFITCCELKEVKLENNKNFFGKSEFPDFDLPAEYCHRAFVIYNPRVFPLLIAEAKTVPYYNMDDVFVTGILREKLNLSIRDISHLYLKKKQLLNPYTTLQEHPQEILFGYDYDADDIKEWSDLTNRNTVKNAATKISIVTNNNSDKLPLVTESVATIIVASNTTETDKKDTDKYKTGHTLHSSIMEIPTSQNPVKAGKNIVDIIFELLNKNGTKTQNDSTESSIIRKNPIINESVTETKADPTKALNIEENPDDIFNLLNEVGIMTLTDAEVASFPGGLATKNPVKSLLYQTDFINILDHRFLFPEFNV